MHTETRKSKQICSGCGSHGGGNLSWLSCALCGKLSHSKCHKEWKEQQTTADMWGFDLCRDCTEFTVKEFRPAFERPKTSDFIKKLQCVVNQLRDKLTVDRVFKTLTTLNPEATRSAAYAFFTAINQQVNMDELVPKDDYFDDEETNFVAMCIEVREVIFAGLLRQMDESKLVQGLRLFWRVLKNQVGLQGPAGLPESPGEEPTVDGPPFSPAQLWTFWRNRWSVGRFVGLGFRKLHALSDVSSDSWPQRRCQLCGCGAEKESLLGCLIPMGAVRWLHAECVKWSVRLEADCGQRPLPFLCPQVCPPSRTSNVDFDVLTPEWREDVEKLIVESNQVNCDFCGNLGASVYSECGEVVAHVPCVLLMSESLRVDAVRRVFAVCPGAGATLSGTDQDVAEPELELAGRVCSVREKLRKIQSSGSLT